MRVHELFAQIRNNFGFGPAAWRPLPARQAEHAARGDRRVLEKVNRGEKLTTAEVAEVAKYARVEERPAKPPEEADATIVDKPPPPPQVIDVVTDPTPAPASKFPRHTENLRRVVWDLEKMLGDDLDEAAEYLISTKQVSRAFKSSVTPWKRIATMRPQAFWARRSVRWRSSIWSHRRHEHAPYRNESRHLSRTSWRQESAMSGPSAFARSPAGWPRIARLRAI